MSSLPPAKPRRTRAFAPKKRSGCITCKVRHVRCDEQKPFCKNCSNTGRVCDGYAETNKQKKTATAASATSGEEDFANLTEAESSTISDTDSASNHAWSTDSPLSASDFSSVDGSQFGDDAALSPRSHAHAQELSTILQNPSISVLEDDKQYRAFYWFQTRTAKQITEAMTTPIWTHLVLQLCQVDPAIRHGVVAIGAMSERLELNDVLTADNEEANKAHGYGLLQYSRALSSLRTRLASDDPHAASFALLACFLFILFEFLQGNDEGVRVHLRSGLGILEHSLANATPLSASNELWSELCMLYTLMDALIPLWVDGETFQSTSLIDLKKFGRPEFEVEKTTFEKIDDAELSQAALSEQIWNFQQTVANCEANSPDAKTVTALRVQQQILIAASSHWLNAFEAWLTEKKDVFDPDDRARLIVIRVDRYVSMIMLAASFKSDKQKVFSSYDAYFSQIVQLSESLILPNNILKNTKALRASRELIGEEQLAPVFLFGDGIIRPLFYTAIHCSNPSISKRALELLSESPWREGAWDSAAMARIAKRRIASAESVEHHESFPVSWKV